MAENFFTHRGLHKIAGNITNVAVLVFLIYDLLVLKFKLFLNGSLSLLSKTTNMRTQRVPLSLLEVWENDVSIQMAPVVIFSRIKREKAEERGEREWMTCSKGAQSRRFSQYPSRNPGSLPLRHYIRGRVFQISQSKALGTFYVTEVKGLPTSRAGTES